MSTTHASHWPMGSALVMAILFLGGCNGTDEVRSEAPPDRQQEEGFTYPPPRQVAEQFRSSELPVLQLEGNTAQVAIDALGRQGFRCTIVPEQENVIDQLRPLGSFVVCQRFLMTERERIYGRVDVSLHMQGWEGDGTAVATRYEQLTTSKVTHTWAAGVYIPDNRDEVAEKNESINLSRTRTIAAPGERLQDVVKHAMTHQIACGITNQSVDQRAILECSESVPSPKCGHALISIALSEGLDAPGALSLWSTDRVVTGKQGPWVCLFAKRTRRQ